MTFSRLHPAGPPVSAVEACAEIARCRDAAPGGRPYVVANMVSTVDGRATVDGSSRALGSEADTEHLLELRAVADAVLVGTETVRAEGYARLVGNAERRGRRVAAGLTEDPSAVLCTRSGDVPWEAGLFAAPEQPVWVYGPAGVVPGDVAAPVDTDPDPSLRHVLGDLRKRGVRLLLCEGGPGLLGALVGAGLLDELCLTIVPALRADDREPGILDGVGGMRGLELRRVLAVGDELFCRYALAQGPG